MLLPPFYAISRTHLLYAAMPCLRQLPYSLTACCYQVKEELRMLGTAATRSIIQRAVLRLAYDNTGAETANSTETGV
eukprot:2690377-Rhodomonas_salina.1